MGLDALLDVVQRLGARGSSASAGGTGLGMARATCTAQAASPISRLRARARVWCEMRSIDEHMDDVEKHVPGVLCEYLGGVNGKEHTKQLHFSDR